MRSLILLAALFSSAAQADSKICGKLIPCGNYRNEQVKDGKKLIHEMSFLASGEDDLLFTLATIHEDGTRSGESSQTLNFSKDGAFTISKNGSIRAAGVCILNACTLAIGPALNGDVQIEQALVYRFTALAAFVTKLYVDETGKSIHSDGVYDKVP